MSFEAVNWAWKQKDMTPWEKLVLLALADRHNPDHGCFPSLNKIVDDTEISRSTVRRCLKQLEKKGLITVQENMRANGSQTSNLYHLHIGSPPVSARHPPSVTLDTPPVSQGTPINQVINKPVSDNLSDHCFDQRRGYNRLSAWYYVLLQLAAFTYFLSSRAPYWDRYFRGV